LEVNVMMYKFLGGIAPRLRCGSLLAVFALAGAGCGGDGGSSMNGTPNPGTTGTPDGGGGGLPTNRDGGSRDVPAAPGSGQSGMAVAKFCNGLRRQTGPIEFTLEIGDQPVRFVAASGQCTPPLGMPCLAIPAGPRVAVKLSLDGAVIGEGAFEIPAGQDVVFEPILSMQPDGTQALNLEGSVYPPGICPEIDLIDVSDGGMPPATDAARPRPPGI
jgi:hypothetical protein